MSMRTLPLLVCTAAFAWAQGGSNYSVFGIGDLRPSIGAFYDGAASLAVALPSPQGISTVNPALWTFVRSTRLQGGYRFHQQSISGEAGTRAQNNGKVEGLLLLFAIDTAAGWSGSFGFYPLSSVNAAVRVPLGVQRLEDTLSGSYSVLSSGGISVLHGGVAVKPLSRLGVGVAVRYYFGLFRADHITRVEDPWAAPDTFSIADWLSGVGAILGAWYQPLPNWLLGVAVSLPARMTTQQVWRYSFAHTYTDTSLTKEFRWRLPAFAAAGLSYQRGRTVVAVELGYAALSSLTYRSAPRVEFQPLFRLSASLVRIPPASKVGRTFWEQLGLSAGVSWQRLYYRVDGRSISETAAACGIGFPLGRSALVEVACQAGVRGKQAPGLVREWFGRFTFSLSLSDQWFIAGRRR